MVIKWPEIIPENVQNGQVQALKQTILWYCPSIHYYTCRCMSVCILVNIYTQKSHTIQNGYQRKKKKKN